MRQVATAYVVLRPDRDRCYAALDHQITTWLASSDTLEALPEPSADAWRKEFALALSVHD